MNCQIFGEEYKLMIKNIKEDKIQCLECEKYYYSITYSHLKKCSDMSIKEYKEKYLNVDLVSQIYRDNKSGENNPMYGIKLIGKLNGNYGKSHSKKTKDILREKFLGKNNHQYKEIFKEEIIYLAQQGLKQKDVVKLLNISINCLNRKLKEFNLKWNKISTYDYSKKGKNNPMWGKKGTWKGKTFTDNHCKNLRISTIKYLESCSGQLAPRYNKNSCKFFDFLNFHLEWNGIHAENGGEYHIKELGYFVDYYEPNINLVIEWNEKNHYDKNGDLKEKDIIRKNEIIEVMNPTYIIIKENMNNNYLKICNNILNVLFEQLKYKKENNKCHQI